MSCYTCQLLIQITQWCNNAVVFSMPHYLLQETCVRRRSHRAWCVLPKFLCTSYTFMFGPCIFPPFRNQRFGNCILVSFRHFQPISEAASVGILAIGALKYYFPGHLILLLEIKCHFPKLHHNLPFSKHPALLDVC